MSHGTVMIVYEPTELTDEQRREYGNQRHACDVIDGSEGGAHDVLVVWREITINDDGEEIFRYHVWAAGAWESIGLDEAQQVLEALVPGEDWETP